MKRRTLSLAAARVNAKLRQKEVAERLEVTTATLQNWESGKTAPNIAYAQRLADMYGVNLDEILFALKL